MPSLTVREGRLRRHRRVRAKVRGNAERPRLAVFRSNRGIEAQLIDDDAGRRRTLAASNRPTTSCVMVEPCLGTVNRFFFASSTAFVIASGTSRALP